MKVSCFVLLGGLLLAPQAAGTAVLASARAADRDPTAPAARAATTVTGVRVFGHSVKGRELRAYRVGDPTSTVKVVLIATMHGNEADPARILLNLMHGDPITGADIWIIPYLNPDGMARHTRKNAHGVDLNRNFPRHWVRQTGHYNSGPKPASEPETRALMRFLDQIRPTFVVSMHQPLNGVDTSYGKARPLALRLVHGLGLPAAMFSCGSGCHGTMTQWFNRTLPGAALTVEYGTSVSRTQSEVTGPNGLLAAVFASR